MSASTTGIKIGLPSLKLNNVGTKSKSCGSFKSVAKEALEERYGLDPDIDRALSNQNFIVGYKSAKDLLAYSEEHIKALSAESIAKGGRKIREDAVAMIVTIIKPPASFMNTLSAEDQLRFLTDALHKFSEIVGEHNIKSVAYHFDELGAHTHIFWEPMTADGRLCAKEVHNLKFFNKINREIPAYMKSKGWNVADCEIYDKASEAEKRKVLGEDEYKKQTAEKLAKRGRSSRAFKADAEADLQKALKEKAAIDNEIKSATEHKAVLEKSIEDDARTISRLNEEIDSAESELVPLRAELDALKKTPSPESPSHLRFVTKSKKSLFGKKIIEIPEDEYEKCSKAYDLYNRAKEILSTVEAKLQAFRNSTVQKLKKLLRIAEKERDEAIKERDEAKRERDKAKAETRAVMEKNESLEKSNADLRWLVSAICDRFMFVRAFVRDIERELQAEERDREDGYHDHDEEEL